MSDKEQVISKAAALGQALAAHPVVKTHTEAQQAARNDADAQQILRDYQEQINHVQMLEAQQKPVEVADKQKLKDLEGKMSSNEALKTLMRTQADYVALMSEVNRAIEGPLSELFTPEKPA